MARAPRIPRIAVDHRGPLVGIDVETACPDHGAVCAIGVSIVHLGRVHSERHWFIDPATRFDPRFIEIHGITPATVAGRPRLKSAWREISGFIDASLGELRDPSLFAEVETAGPTPLFVAHNAQFDRTQIEAALDAPLPFRLACTVAMSRRAFPRLARHNLKTVAEHLRIPLKHHDALSDARACALIAHRCLAIGAGN